MFLKYSGLEKIILLLKIVKENGGWRSSLYKLYRNDDLKFGKHVGTDADGNKYFENNYYFYGRNRWVDFAPKYGIDYDASQINAEWYGWMHYKTDLLPTEDKSRPKYKWMLPHTENLTGTTQQYMPYCTTRPKIEVWRPPKVQKIAKATKA